MQIIFAEKLCIRFIALLVSISARAKYKSRGSIQQCAIPCPRLPGALITGKIALLMIIALQNPTEKVNRES